MMKTDDFIARLVHDARVLRRGPRHGVFYACIAVGLALAALAVAFFLGVRPDAPQAVWAIALKSAYALAAIAVLFPLLSRLLEPATGLGVHARPVFLFAAISVMAALASLYVDQSWHGLRLEAGFPECLRRVPLLATPTAVLLFLSARSYAPTRLALAGAAIGALSAAVAILAYAWFCSIDSMAYVGVWYLAAIGVSAALGAVVGPWALRW
jgi:hypothetical protein